MKYYILSIFISLLTITSYSQTIPRQPSGSFHKRVTITGYISDKENGEKLAGVIIQDENTKNTVMTNTYGFYCLACTEGKVRLKYSILGYQGEVKELLLSGNLEINIQLTPSTIGLKEVTVYANTPGNHLESSQMGISELQMKNLKSFPVLIGENDVMKTLQLLPGIQQGNEGSSSLFVRGGNADQNLILLDGAPVYNVNHLFGYMSTFNDDAIQSVNALKGGIPARYGGRLSSVVDIKMKEGNNKKFTSQLSIGTLASRLTLEGPVVNENTSFIFSARRTYFDLLTRPIMQIFSTEQSKTLLYYYFQDYNLKLNHRFSSKSHLYLSLYTGSDVIKSDQHSIYQNNDIQEKGSVKWGNITATSRWNYKISDKLFSNAAFIYSQYKIQYTDNSSLKDSIQITQHFLDKYHSGIQDYNLKLDFDYYLNSNHMIKFGIQNTLHSFNPGYLISKSSIENITNSETDTTIRLNYIHLFENEVYIEDDIHITSRLKTNIGLRYSVANIQDKFYKAIQPRVNLRYMLSDHCSAKASWSLMNQNLNLLTGPSSIGIPMDLWIPVTKKLKPQLSNIYSMGILYTIQNKLEISTEWYYKTLLHTIDFKEGTNYTFADQDWESKIEQGKGRAYGFEFLLEKKTGKTFGWLGYTLAKSSRQFDHINHGNWFPYQFNRTHNLNLVIAHHINNHLEIGATWVVSSGRLLTVNNQKYSSYLEPGKNIETYDARNNYQTPIYHRLDLSVRFSKQKKNGIRTWTIGCYNVYNHKSASVVYMENNQLKQLNSLPIIPSVTYSFRFQKKQDIKRESDNFMEEVYPSDSVQNTREMPNSDTLSDRNLPKLKTSSRKFKKVSYFEFSYQISKIGGSNLDIAFISGKYRTPHYALCSDVTMTYQWNQVADSMRSSYYMKYGLLNRYELLKTKIRPFIQITPTLFVGSYNSQIRGGLLIPFGGGTTFYIHDRISAEVQVMDDLLKLKGNLHLKVGFQWRIHR